MGISKPWLAVYGDRMPYDIEVPDMPLYGILTASAKAYPDHPAISYNGQTQSYRELEESAAAFAAALRQSGFTKGGRVAIMLHNCPEYMAAYFGVLMAGGVVVQINTMYTERELQLILSDSQAERIVVNDVCYPVVKAVTGQTALKRCIVVPYKSDLTAYAPDIAYESFVSGGAAGFVPEDIDPAEDVGVLQYTGGTTGRSKGAMLTHRNLVANVHQFSVFMKELILPRRERFLAALPFFHVYGMTDCMNLSVYNGGCCVLLPRFELQLALDTIKRERPTVFPGAPTMYLAILSHPHAEQYGIDSIKLCVSGGASMPVERMKEFEHKTGALIFEGYGMSEASPTTHLNPSFGSRKPGSVGIGLCATDYKVVDIGTGTNVLPPGEVGELIIKGPQVMKGYWNMPEETAVTLRNGWLYSGDIAKMDEEGYVYIVDRKKDVIIASGYNVYPRDVEEVLYEHPAVQETVVVGAADAYRGETVRAVIVLKEGTRVTEDEIIAFCRQNMAAYKVPRIVEFRKELPKSGAGKILRRALRDNT